MTLHSEYRSLSIPERLAILETQMAEIKVTQDRTEHKLDELIALRNKGLGAFLLVSGLTGTGVIGLVAMFLAWIRGH